MKNMNGAMQKTDVVKQDWILMGLLHLSKVGNSFTCVQDAEKTMDILTQLTEIEGLKQYFGYTNENSLLLLHLDTYKSDEVYQPMSSDIFLELPICIRIRSIREYIVFIPRRYNYGFRSDEYGEMVSMAMIRGE